MYVNGFVMVEFVSNEDFTIFDNKCIHSIIQSLQQEQKYANFLSFVDICDTKPKAND